MNMLTNVLAAFGLAGSAGLNAYLPLLVVALLARYTSFIKLVEPWTALENGWVIGALLLLLGVEFFADKVPAVNHANDAIQTFVRPAAGAILFAASTTQAVSNVSPVLAVILGLLTAGAVHAAKAGVVRPLVTATSGGVANPVVSVAEDVLALFISVLAVILPVLISALIVMAAALVIWWLWRRSARTASA